MDGGTEADLPAMDKMAGELSQSASSLDGAGKTTSGIPDAGDVSGIMGSTLAYLTGNAANLVLGLQGASDEVSQARKDYADKDRSAARSLQGD